MCTVHVQKRLFMNFRCKFRHRRSIRPPDFLLECKTSAIWRRFPPYFYFRFVWPFDLESIPHASTPTSIILTKFEVPMPIRFWVISYNGSHWLPLKVRTRPLRMRRITWSVIRGSKTITFLESPLSIHYTTFIGLRRRLRAVYSRAVQCYSRFRAKKF